MTAELFDVIVIGGGIAGASLGALLSCDLRVAVLERETHPGLHSTGRSAALFSETYGSPLIRALSSASRDLLFAPPPQFCPTPLLTPRGALIVAREDQLPQLELFSQSSDMRATTERIDTEAALRLSPLLRPESVAAAIYEPGAQDIDVDALHQAYLKQLRANAGRLMVETEVIQATYNDGCWRVETTAGVYQAPVLVNAAGAWADEIARRAQVRPMDIQPKRRTVVMADLAQTPVERCPLTLDVDEQFYFKSESGGLLLSPADETPSEACDAYPDDYDVAVAIDRVEQATTAQVRRVRSKWSGLRSFSPDRNPVAGFAEEGFFWLAGQGGYGIQTGPALAIFAAAVILGRDLPGPIQAAGIDPAQLSPGRFTPGG